MTDPLSIESEVEALFDDIDSVEMRARFRRKKKLSSRCPDCAGRGERWNGSTESHHGYWIPCDRCHPERGG